MSEGDQEVFEITDFTNASELEKFSSRIEELIHEWNVAGPRNYKPFQKGDIVSKEWEVKVEVLSYANFSLEAMLHRIKEEESETNVIYEDDNRRNAGHDMMSHLNDFPHKAHCLSRWYGLREFIVLVPMGKKEIATEDRTRLLISSLNVAICATKCEVPIFVQVLQPHLKQFLGVGNTEHYSTEYSISVLPNPPSDCENLQGLLGIFKSKLGWPYISLPKVTIAARFTYVLQDQGFENWFQSPPTFALEVIRPKNLKSVPFGALEDPIKDVFLYVTWPKINDGEMTEADNISNFLPLNAPQWSLKVKAKDEFSKSMSEFLQSFMNFKEYSSEPILGVNTYEETEQMIELYKSLEKLVDTPVPRLSSKGSDMIYFSDFNVIKLLQFIFPDTCEEQEDFGMEDAWHDCPDFSDSSSHPLYTHLLNIKSAPRGSLTYRIALTLAHLKILGEKAVIHVWNEFVKELRHRLDHNLALPNIAPGRPILTTCLLHQKLQMLNYCITIKKKRDCKYVPDSDYEVEDDIFFDCNESPRKSKESSLESDVSKNADKGSETNKKREGALKKCGNLTLLDSDEPIYIPQTQDPPPMTEDMLEEQSNLLMNLGSNSAGAALRARLQSSTLLSDMASFKAANPSTRLEDFVRWYSPRDWCETTQKDADESTPKISGELSQRMLIPGNIWQETWESAPAIPAHRQNRLFDDTKEAQLVIKYLATINSTQLVEGMMPMLIVASLSHMVDLVNDSCKGLAAKKLEQICVKAAKVSTSPKPRYEEIMVEMEQLEAYISQAKALVSMLKKQNLTLHEETHVWDFALKLLDNQEVELEGQQKGIIGQRVAKLFSAPQNDSDEEGEDKNENPIFPPPVGREFILRCTIPPYACNSLAPIPNRMHCIYSNNTFRLVGAFSKDTIHY